MRVDLVHIVRCPLLYSRVGGCHGEFVGCPVGTHRHTMTCYKQWPDMSRFMPSLLLLSLLSSSSLLLSPPPNSLHLIWFCRRATIYESGVRYVCLDAHRSYRNVTPVKIPPLLVFHLKVFYYLAVLLETEPVCKRYYNTSKK